MWLDRYWRAFPCIAFPQEKAYPKILILLFCLFLQPGQKGREIKWNKLKKLSLDDWGGQKKSIIESQDGQGGMGALEATWSKPSAQAGPLRTMSRLLLSISKNRDSTSLPGQPVSVFGHSHSEKVSPEVQLEINVQRCTKHVFLKNCSTYQLHSCFLEITKCAVCV